MREIAIVSSTGLNLHRERDPASHVIDQLQYHDEMLILLREKNWLRVKVTKTKTGIGEGEYGWVDGHYVTIRREPEPEPVPPPPAPLPKPEWRPFDLLLTLGSAAGVVALVAWGLGKLAGAW